MSTSIIAQGTLSEPLAGYIRQYEYICNDVESLVTGLSDAQFNWRPAPGQWSVAECLGHLIITTGEKLPVIDGLIAQAQSRTLRSQGPYRSTLLGNWLIRFVEPPYRTKVKSRPHMTPPSEAKLTDVVPAFLDLQEQMRERIERCSGLDLGAVRGKSSIPFSLTLGQWIEFIAAHERRHLWQARNVRNHPEFPR